jgi:hypothetical protein
MVTGIVSSPATGISAQFSTTLLLMPHHCILWLPREISLNHPWLLVRNPLTGLQTVQDYGLRFDSAENFVDDQSTGFQWEDSKLRSAAAIERLVFGLATATLYLVVQGSEVVAPGRRREVDPHWFRGSSYLKIGWQWLQHAMLKGWQLITGWCLRGEGRILIPPGHRAGSMRPRSVNSSDLLV